MTTDEVRAPLPAQILRANGDVPVLSDAQHHVESCDNYSFEQWFAVMLSYGASCRQGQPDNLMRYADLGRTHGGKFRRQLAQHLTRATPDQQGWLFVSTAQQPSPLARLLCYYPQLWGVVKEWLESVAPQPKPSPTASEGSVQSRAPQSSGWRRPTRWGGLSLVMAAIAVGASAWWVQGHNLPGLGMVPSLLSWAAFSTLVVGLALWSWRRGRPIKAAPSPSEPVTTDQQASEPGLIAQQAQKFRASMEQLRPHWEASSALFTSLPAGSSMVTWRQRTLEHGVRLPWFVWQPQLFEDPVDVPLPDLRVEGRLPPLQPSTALLVLMQQAVLVGASRWDSVLPEPKQVAHVLLYLNKLAAEGGQEEARHAATQSHASRWLLHGVLMAELMSGSMTTCVALHQAFDAGSHQSLLMDAIHWATTTDDEAATMYRRLQMRYASFRADHPDPGRDMTWLAGSLVYAHHKVTWQHNQQPSWLTTVSEAQQQAILQGLVARYPTEDRRLLEASLCSLVQRHDEVTEPRDSASHPRGPASAPMARVSTSPENLAAAPRARSGGAEDAGPTSTLASSDVLEDDAVSPPALGERAAEKRRMGAEASSGAGGGDAASMGAATELADIAARRRAAWEATKAAVPPTVATNRNAMFGRGSLADLASGASGVRASHGRVLGGGEKPRPSGGPC